MNPKHPKKIEIAMNLGLLPLAFFDFEVLLDLSTNEDGTSCERDACVCDHHDHVPVWMIFESSRTLMKRLAFLAQMLQV